MEPKYVLPLYPHGAPSACTCELVMLESGEIVEPDLAKCVFTVEAHRPALEQARSRLETVRVKEGKK